MISVESREANSGVLNLPNCSPPKAAVELSLAIFRFPWFEERVAVAPQVFVAFINEAAHCFLEVPHFRLIDIKGRVDIV